MIERPTSADVQEMRERTGLGLYECRKKLNAEWRRKVLAEFKEREKAGRPVLMPELIEFLGVMDRDHTNKM